MRTFLVVSAAALILFSTMLAAPALAAAASTDPALPTGRVAARGSVAHCGQPILANATAFLSGDLHCSLAMADGATLDLNHHSLIGAGPAAGDAIRYLATPGLIQSTNLTLKNGTITHWGRVFGVPDGPGVTLRRMSITHTVTAFSGFHSFVNADRSQFVNNGTVMTGGIVSAVFSNSIFQNNRIGISNYFGGIISVSNSSFTNSDTALECTQAQTTVAGTSFIGNRVAMSLQGCAGATVTDSSFVDNRTALTTALYSPCGPCSNSAAQQATSDQLRHNRFQGNGIAVLASHSATMLSNTFTNNGGAVRSLAPTDGAVAPTITLTSNTFTRNGDAVYVLNPAPLRANVATWNRGYGIYAPAAVDLGGNVAYGNGRSPQCTGVVCSRR